jgi:hypothetical protein
MQACCLNFHVLSTVHRNFGPCAVIPYGEKVVMPHHARITCVAIGESIPANH